jgi:hydrogenase maturation factor
MVPNPTNLQEPAFDVAIADAEGPELAIDFAALEPVADNLAAAALALARRFSTGATMWCVSPGWPAHGRHVAVEFVHPVIMGKRALPAIFVDDDDLVGALRVLVRPGDLLVALGNAKEGKLAPLLRRAEAWGLTTVWIGAGPRPPSSVADHLLWVDGVDPDIAGSSGGYVLLYHLLWELVHVVFEHSGLLVEPPACTDEVCITCSDEGRLVEVVSLEAGNTAVVLAQGHRETIDITLVGVPVPGDLLLVHAGTAITAVDEYGL